MTYTATMIVERSITPNELPSSRSAGEAPAAGSGANIMVRLKGPVCEHTRTYSRQKKLRVGFVMNLIYIAECVRYSCRVVMIVESPYCRR